MQVRKEQMEAFREPLRKGAPEVLRQNLSDLGAQAGRDPKTGDVLATDSLGRTRRFSFNDDGLIRTVTEPSGLQSHYEHDEQGRVAAVVHPGSRRVEMERDENGHLTVLRRPGLCTYQLKHDDDGRLLSLQYPGGKAVRFTYATGTQLTSMTDQTGAMTTQTHSDEERVRTITDPLGRPLRFHLDTAGALERIAFPDGSEQVYGYFDDEDVAAIVLRDGSPVQMHLDDQGMIRTTTWADGSETRFKYDGDGNVVAATTATTTTRFDLNDDACPVVETTDAGDVTCEYDSEGQLTSIETPHGEKVAYEYDEDGRVACVVDWEGREIHLDYGPDGCLAAIRYPNQLIERQKFPDLGQMAEATVVGRDGRVRSHQTYQYDPCERLTAMSDSWGTTPDASLRRRFTYDDAHRLTAETDAASGKPITEFDYDAKGNMVRAGATGIAIGLMDEPRTFGGVAIGYDDNGNMTRLPGLRGPIGCAWSADGTLRQATTGRGTWRYSYDGLGRRISKTDGKQTWRFGWSGYRLLWEEYQATSDAEPERRDYLWMPEGMAPLAFREGEDTYWLQRDARGAVIRAFDADGTTVWSATYDSFGEARVRVDKVRQPFRLVGQYHDEETGLHYNLGRYYSPTLRSYISMDPNWMEFGTAYYAYCKNNPWNCIDPYGTFLIMAALATVAIGAVAGAVIGGVMSSAMGGSFWTGALEGGIAGACTAVGTLVGGPVGAYVGGVIGSGAGAFAGSCFEQWRRGDPVNYKCAATAAAWAMAFDAALLVAGKIPFVKRGLKWVGKKLKPARKYVSRVVRRSYHKTTGLLTKQWFKLNPSARIKRNLRITRAAQVAGMSKNQARKAFRVANKRGVWARFRPTNPESVQWRNRGHSPKPCFVKNKTLNRIDVDYLGANPKDIGKVGGFKPKLPDKAALEAIKAQDETLYKKITGRFQSRADEVLQQKALNRRLKKLGKRISLGKADPKDIAEHARLKKNLGRYRMENGLVIDNRATIRGKPNPGYGKAFTGDNDLFDFKGRFGQPLSDTERAAVCKDLRGGPINVQHTDHMSWPKDSPDTFRRNQDMYYNIVDGHTKTPQLSSRPRGEALASFGPGYQFRETYATPVPPRPKSRPLPK